MSVTYTLGEVFADLEKIQAYRHGCKLHKPVSDICLKIILARKLLAPAQAGYLAKRKNRNI